MNVVFVEGCGGGGGGTNGIDIVRFSYVAWITNLEADGKSACPFH